MKSFSIVISVAVAVNIAYHHHVVTAYEVDDAHHPDDLHSHDHHYFDSDYEDIQNHHHYHHHMDHDMQDHTDHDHRGLRLHETPTPMDIGNHTYASKYDFIRSGHRCGSRKPSRKKVKESNDRLSKWMTDEKHRMDQTTNIVIPTYFHVITSGKTGTISNSTLKNQLQVLNDLYKTYGFSFRLVKTTRTNNRSWYYATIGSTAETNMFKKLRVGGASTLNVYFNDASGNLGYAALPMYYDDKPVQDGVVVLSGSVPGGSVTYYNEGKTLVHEVGHWLGLLHTFDTNHISRNGCLGNGDFVSDTPRQRYPTMGCPVRQDSCPNSGGLDMVSNFMDYSDDVCLTKFTTGQKNRMHAMWDTYRA